MMVLRLPAAVILATMPIAQPAVFAGAEERADVSVDPAIWPRATSPFEADPDIEARIADLLKTWTVERKAGQIIMADIASVTPQDVADYHLGAILNGGNSAPNGDLRSSPADWLALADAFWEASVGPDGAGMPVLWGTDAVHGHANVVGATIFPHNIGLGAAHDPELVGRIAAVTAKEVTATGLDWTFAPTLAVPRDLRWGRTYEGYSEDPRIVASYAAKAVSGLQGVPGTPGFLGPDKVIATAKHFVGDGGTLDGKDQGETAASEEELRDIHAAAYVPAIQAGVQTVMASFSSWQEVKTHASRALLTDILVGAMGFDGFVLGDWNGHGQVPGCTSTDCPKALAAGIDMFMAPDSWQELYATTLAQVEDGTIATERLDEAVARVLRVKLRAGLPGRGKPSDRPLAGDFDLLGAPAHRALAREAVRRSLVLLKNEDVLPIAPGARVLVTGAGADDMGLQTGGWTLSWQGDGTTRDDFPGAQTIYEGLREAVEAGGGEAVLSPDGSFETAPDVAVIVFGEKPYAEFEGDLETIEWRGHRAVGLMRAFRDRGIPVVSVFLSGRPMFMPVELGLSEAFVAAWLPGSEGGGVADLLIAGADGAPRHDFTGRLSFSWPASPGQAAMNIGDPDYAPLYPVGYGLTYAGAD